MGLYDWPIHPLPKKIASYEPALNIYIEYLKPYSSLDRAIHENKP
jgi:hypothetical protein